MRCASLELKYKKLEGGEKIALMNAFAEDATQGIRNLEGEWQRSPVGYSASTGRGADLAFERRCYFFLKSLERLLADCRHFELRQAVVGFLKDATVPKVLKAEAKHLVAKSFMRSSDYRSAPTFLKEALADLNNETQDYSALGIYCDLAICFYNLDEAFLVETYLRRIYAELNKHDFAAAIRQRTLNLLGQLSLDRGAFVEARRYYQESLEYIEDNPSSPEAIRLRLYLFGLEKDTGHLLEARLLETRLEGEIARGTVSDIYDFHRNRAGLRLLEGDRAAAEVEYQKSSVLCDDDIERFLLRLEWCEKSAQTNGFDAVTLLRLEELESLAPACGKSNEWIARSLRAAALAAQGDRTGALLALRQSAAYFIESRRFHDLERDFKNLVLVSPKADDGKSLIEIADRVVKLAAAGEVPNGILSQAKAILQEPMPLDSLNRFYLDLARERVLDNSGQPVLDLRDQPLLWRLLMAFVENTQSHLDEAGLVSRIWNEQHFNESHPPKIRRALHRLRLKFAAAGIRLAPVVRNSKGYSINPSLSIEVHKSS